MVVCGADPICVHSAPLIFAAGDVAEYNSKTLGLWTVAVSQAEVAAVNAIREGMDVSALLDALQAGDWRIFMDAE